MVPAKVKRDNVELVSSDYNGPDDDSHTDELESGADDDELERYCETFGQIFNVGYFPTRLF